MSKESISKKSLYDIAHDYKGVNLSVIEWIIRYDLDKFKIQSKELIKDNKADYC